MKKRRTNHDRVAELNRILGPVKKYTGLYFAVLRNVRECVHPYALCYKMSPERSLDFKGMKTMALRMRAVYDAGGDKIAIMMETYN